jgi:G3E family GTPase
VVCVVDAENFEDLHESQPEVRLQLALADLVLVNKTDCVAATYLPELEKLIRTTNQLARISYTTFGNTAGIDVLDTNSFSGEVIEKSTLSFCGVDLKAVSEAGKRSFVHNPTNPKPQHKHDITSVGFTFAGSFDVNKFGLWMQNYLYFNREQIFRVKGIVSFDQTDDQFIFHAVRSSFMFEVGKPWADDPRFSKLVFIGKDLSANELEANLLQLMVKS